MTNASERIARLRDEMAREGIDVYLVPSSDPHQSEYVPDAWQRRAWLSGFTGSMGDCALGREAAWLWVDSRYWLQAEAELDTDVWTVMKVGQPEVPKMVAWIQTLPADTVVGYDPRLIGVTALSRLEAGASSAGVHLRSVDDNLVDCAWVDRPSLPAAPTAVLDTDYAGASVRAKLDRIREALADAERDVLVLTTLDAIAWTFNIRGGDVDFNPVTIAYALVDADAATLFIDDAKVGPDVREHLAAADVRLRPYGDFGGALEALDGRVWIDRDHASAWVARRLEAGGAEVDRRPSPVLRLKAEKNATEQRGMREAHVRDGVAVTRFLRWLETAWRDGDLDELAAATELGRLRADGERYRGPSFETISGFGPHGAVVHYRVTSATSRAIDDSSLYLVDSGGQYLDGTTDVTRTVHLGTPTRDQKRHYTLVLKGHLALARAVFPRGTTGTHLDAFARAPLWEAGLNYGHGTGHGVGTFLCVHEGPQRISPGWNATALAPGMVVSNEPGLYLVGEYGIRVENLVLVVEADLDAGAHGPFYRFEDLTLAPHCRRLIDLDVLSDQERAQIDAYHARVRDALGPRLDPDDRAWLERETAPISR